MLSNGTDVLNKTILPKIHATLTTTELHLYNTIICRFYYCKNDDDIVSPHLKYWQWLKVLKIAKNARVFMRNIKNVEKTVFF